MVILSIVFAVHNGLTKMKSILPSQQARKVKHRKQGRSDDLLENKKKHLFYLKDACKEEIMKELVRGEMPARDCLTWLQEVDMLDEKNHEHMNMHDEITKCLKSYSFYHSLLNHSSGRKIGGRIVVLSVAPVPPEKLQKAKLRRTETTRLKATSVQREEDTDHVSRGKTPVKHEIVQCDEVTDPASSIPEYKQEYEYVSITENKQEYEYVSSKAKRASLQREEEQTDPISPMRKKITVTAAVSGPVMVESETSIALETKSSLIPDFKPSSNATRRVEEEHHETALFPATEILPTHETEIELAPVSEEKISTHESDIFPSHHETALFPATEILPTHETEIELAPVSEEKISRHESDIFPSHHETALFPATEILPTHETEIELAPVSEEKISMHESDIFPAVPNGTNKMLVIPETEATEGTKMPNIPETEATEGTKMPDITADSSNTTTMEQLKHSYDELQAPDQQFCFLYCALFPGHKMKVSELVEWWIQEGFIARNMVDARKRGLDIVKSLVDAALLEDCEEGVCKMNDAARDLALWILSQDVKGRLFVLRARPNLESGSLSTSLESLERDKFLMRAGAGLSQPPPEKEWEQRKMIFLMDNKFSSLPAKPSCPSLLILFIQRNHRLRVIPENFFEVMPSLEVLNLSKTRINSLPASLSNLRSLKTLIMRDCERLVRLPSDVGKLTTLEVLDLNGTEINHLPDEIGNLTSLWYLDISFYGPVDHREYPELPSLLISPGILSKLIALKNLSIVVNPGDKRWKENTKSVVMDVSRLRNLTFLSFYFPKEDLLKLFAKKSPSWRHTNFTFNFVVGQDIKRALSRVPHYVEFEYNQHDRCLRLVNGEDNPNAILEVLTRTTAFYLDHRLNISSLSKIQVSKTKLLKLCVVRECPEMKTIIDKAELTLPHLECLSLHYLGNLRRIWGNFTPSHSYSSLKFLSVHTCPQLDFVLTAAMSKNTPNLEELVVEDCQAIRVIISEERDHSNADEVLLPRLKKLTLHHLPELFRIWKGSWPSLELMSFYNCPSLKNLHIDSNSNSKLNSSIKKIEAAEKWWNTLRWEECPLSDELLARFIPIL